MNKIIIMICLFVFFTGCSVSEEFADYRNIKSDTKCDLDIYSQNLETNMKTKVIGDIAITDTGFTIFCDAKTVIKKIKDRACSIGADAIHLYDVKQPHILGSTCFQAKARFLIYTDKKN
jgi:lipopolysaccharide export system protein LptA